MPLDRPPEKRWHFRQPVGGEQFPSCPSRGAFLSPSGGGKTTTIVALLLGPYRRTFDALYVFSPSVDLDSAWDPVRETLLPGLKHGGAFFSEWDEKGLRDILDRQRQLVQEQKRAKKSEISQVLVIIDDFADNPAVLHSSSGILTTLMIRGRHFGCNTWVSSQKLTALSQIIRVNLQFLLIWRLRNYRELESVIEELSALYPRKVLMAMYEISTSEPFGFWVILLAAKKKSEMFFRGFEEKLVVKDGEPPEK
jgi:hypothetical protein